ncbi:hypothetical protein RAB70_17390 [Xanthomonas sontii]|uniref:hypothetical protein n=1 Tax=Xanthomonas sontii TaxID=2650745 RepID=UPI0011E48201|nr:hypothetical protein [Xanthomonas sontii]MDQ7759042.1 hypothetical protein [Xanthomonas sontii]TYD33942.1 hypothetical protein CEK63_13480 [Xanthomonas sontii]UZK07781.1 hypothetical protein CJ027_014125 [Xanthomonas sontii]
MNQFMADQIDQLDLAIDQLAVRERNFDRFALMLVDNVVELVLHQYAKDSLMRRRTLAGELEPELKTAVAATGRAFDAKVAYARETQMIAAATADSIQYLHSFRNSAYHQGSRHEGILHSLAVFYFRAACAVLKAYKPAFYGIYSGDQISHRAVKYLGRPGIFDQKDAFARAFDRLAEVAEALGESLIDDLQADMLATIDQVDDGLNFIADNAPNRPSRDEAVRHCQAWPFAWTDQAKAFVKSKGFKASNMGEVVEWLGHNYNWQVKTDPIASWKRRHASLKKERDADAALKKYCDFMNQTVSFRAALDEGVSQLDGYIQEQIDLARGK